jgi:hypothetical protein
MTWSQHPGREKALSWRKPPFLPRPCLTTIQLFRDIVGDAEEFRDVDGTDKIWRADE